MGDIMINKQGLIFLTLTSLILVLSVYYVTMPNELLLTTNSSYNTNDNLVANNVNNENTGSVEISTSSTIEAMKSILNDERIKKMQELNDKLTNKELSIEEKNNIYDEIKIINKIETMEDNAQKIIKEQFDLSSFVKIKDDVMEVVINSGKHDVNLAVKIMTALEKEYQDMYISVSFKE